MGRTTRTPYPPRHGLTLVELLVVIAIIAGLAALLVLIFPRLQDSQRSSKAADIVQGQLFIAKQMALRDQLPRGVRLVSSAGNPTGPFDQLQLIEQPPAYSVGVVPNRRTGRNTPWPLDATGWFPVQFRADPSTGAVADFNKTGTVVPGDFLDLSAGNDSYTVTTPPQPGSMHMIMRVSPPNAAPEIWVLTPPNVAYTGAPPPFDTIAYRIVRSPRPLTGEAPVNLPNGIVVDAAQAGGGGTLVPQDTDGHFDILFDPSGKVIRASGAQGKVVLWVKDVTGDPMTADQTLIAVYTRTGLITAQPVNVGSGSPYSFVQDGATSGM